jgi:hypothetical protein
MSPSGVRTMGRKKGASMSVVKIATEYVRKAKLVAQARGQTLSEYLTAIVGVAVDKDFPKVWRDMAKKEGGEKGSASN